MIVRKCSSVIRSLSGIGSMAAGASSKTQVASFSAIAIPSPLEAAETQSETPAITLTEPSTESLTSTRKTTRRILATNAPVTETTSIIREFSSVDSSAHIEHESPFIQPAYSNREKLPAESLKLDVLRDVNNDGSEISLEELRQLASNRCTPLSLSDMYHYASANANSKNYRPQRLRNAQFLHRELPIRVAQRAVDLLTLPHGLNKTSQVQEIAHKYLQYLQILKEFPCPTNEAEELQFTDILRSVISDRTQIPAAIAKGVESLKDHRKEQLDMQRLQEMEKALYRFFNARTGLRLLAEHHILSCTKRLEENEEMRMKQSYLQSVPLNSKVNVYGNDNGGGNGSGSKAGSTPFLGCIRADCDPYIEAQAVAEQVKVYCKECYGIAPDIEVLDCTPERFADSKFTYVPHHLQTTLSELLKNSCRATVKRHLEGTVTTEDHVGSHNNEEGVATNNSLPSVRVVIAKGAEDVTIKVADKGGGVPRSVISKMWTFAHSGTHGDEFTNDIRGFGLPLARIYARYFGGELTLKSMEGYGVDAYLYLPVLGDACENLPERVQKSPGNHDSVHDANHHVYLGDSFSSTYLSGEEPWSGGLRYFSSVAFEKMGRIAL